MRPTNPLHPESRVRLRDVGAHLRYFLPHACISWSNRVFIQWHSADGENLLEEASLSKLQCFQYIKWLELGNSGTWRDYRDTLA